MASENEPIYKYQPLWGGWQIEGFIGKGSFGSVYKVWKEDLGYRYTSAVKIITVPNEDQYREARASIDTDEDTLSGYFQDIVSNIVKEINLLYELRGNSNIVSYEDHMVVKREDEIGWDILIRMEHATSFTKYITERQLTLEQVVQLGIDICSALHTCEKAGIIHRDIKDENIFVSGKGIFKLGDFGIAKELSKSGRAASRMGTPLYMAPEVFRGEKYNLTADIYSLGIVIYRLLNNSRMPFMPAYPAEIRYKDSEAALDKRMAGETLPPLQKDYGRLNAIVLKACSYNPMDRYPSAMAMKKDLEAALDALGAEEKSTLVTLLKSKEDKYSSKNTSGSKNILGSKDITGSGNTSVPGSGSISAQVNSQQTRGAVEDELAQFPGNGTISIANMGLQADSSENSGQAFEQPDGEDSLNKTASIFGATVGKKPEDASRPPAPAAQEVVAAQPAGGVDGGAGPAGDIEAGSKDTNTTANETVDGENNTGKRGWLFSGSKKIIAAGAAGIIVIAAVIIVIALSGNNGANSGKAGAAVAAYETTPAIADASLTPAASQIPEETTAAVTEPSTTPTAAPAEETPSAASTTVPAAETTSAAPTTVQAAATPVKPSSDTTKNGGTQTKETATKAPQDTKKPTTKAAQAAKQTTPAQTPPSAPATTATVPEAPATTNSDASISDFKLSVTIGASYTFYVASPKNSHSYTYIFSARENKGGDLGEVYRTSTVSTSGSFNYTWQPPKQDTIYYITLEVIGDGFDGRIKGAFTNF